MVSIFETLSQQVAWPPECFLHGIGEAGHSGAREATHSAEARVGAGVNSILANSTWGSLLQVSLPHRLLWCPGTNAEKTTGKVRVSLGEHFRNVTYSYMQNCRRVPQVLVLMDSGIIKVLFTFFKYLFLNLFFFWKG